MPTTEIKNALEYLAACRTDAVRLHAARTLGSPRRFGPIQSLRDAAARDMLARDVRELFLLPYVQARRTSRLRGAASGILGPVLAANGSVALDALLARGCSQVDSSIEWLLEDMLSRSHASGFFHEPHQKVRTQKELADIQESLLFVTATYLRYLLLFGLGRDPRVRLAFDRLVALQEPDGTWRPRPGRWASAIDSYLITRAIALAFAALPAGGLKRYAHARRKLAAGLSARVLANIDHPDTVLTELNVAADPLAPSGGDPEFGLPAALRRRVLYFPLEDLWLALEIGGVPTHPHLQPWVEWLRDTQLANGAWQLDDPGTRERLLLSDPNGRLRAESLHLTDEWITLRAAQILRLAERRMRSAPQKT